MEPERENFIDIRPSGDGAVWVAFGNPGSAVIDAETNRRVHALARALRAHPLDGLGEAVPGYAALVLYYDPLVRGYDEVEAHLRRVLAVADSDSSTTTRVVEIPVRYGGEDGPDLGFISAQCGLSESEVIAIHSGREYPVYLMGFSPGFPYLGGMDPRIAAPRLESPRSRVPAGSVGIAGEQTGIYPVDSPGGWRIIGRTEARLFDLTREPPFLLSPGDLVRFVVASD